MTRFSLLLLTATACDADVPEGRVTARIYAEDFVERGIPSSMFGDGWSLKFERFLVSIGEVGIDGTERAGSDSFRIIDLAKPSRGKGHALDSFGAPIGTYDRFRYTIAPSPDATLGNASAADGAAMIAAGSSVWITATAIKGERRVGLDVRFSLGIVHDCAIAAQLDTELAVQATFHGDHILFDATRPEPYVRFDLIADADGRDGSRPDGVIRNAELAATDVRADPRYRVPGVDDLARYVEQQLASVGHVNGEGDCRVRVQPRH